MCDERQRSFQQPCIARENAQQTSGPGISPPTMMMHCITCDSIPARNHRGMCVTCAATCHKGHETYVGSWSRFYFSCGFGTCGQTQTNRRSRKGKDKVIHQHKASSTHLFLPFRGQCYAITSRITTTMELPSEKCYID